MSFNELGLRPELLRAVSDLGYDRPTPIQIKAIPHVLSGEDVLGCAQTGTGKTAAFLLPLLDRLAGGKPGGLRALILTPTRELAAQIGDSARRYGAHLKLRSAAVFGGVGMAPQTDQLRRGVDLLIATPGRLIDHLDRGHLDFRGLQILVLDEADRMLDMGFLPAVKRILAVLPRERQNLFFSATIPAEIEELIGRTMRAPRVVDAGPRATPARAVEQSLYPVSADLKRDLLCWLLGREGMDQVLIFTRTKVRADRLARHLERTGRKVAAIHGDKSQGARTRALAGFKDGRIDTLVATDLAARGIDVEGISHVVNFDVPHVPEDYVHRIGRTGRASASGDAITLCAPEERDQIRGIERLIGRSLPRLEWPGAKLAAAAAPVLSPSPAPLRATAAAHSMRNSRHSRFHHPGQRSAARKGGQ